MNRWMFLSLLALAGCFQAYNEDDDLRTVPVTNNPHVVPNYGAAFQGWAAVTSRGPIDNLLNSYTLELGQQMENKPSYHFFPCDPERSLLSSAKKVLIDVLRKMLFDPQF